MISALRHQREDREGHEVEVNARSRTEGEACQSPERDNILR